jgi:hypothetical protein
VWFASSAIKSTFKGGDMLYQIKVCGELDQSWVDWLGEVAISKERQEDGGVITALLVEAQDQSVLFGILDRIRDMNLILVSANSINV